MYEKTTAKLYYGELNPFEELNGFSSEANSKFCRAYDKFESRLSDKMKIKLDDLYQLHCNVCDEEKLEAFINGFRLGAKLMSE